MAQTRLLIWLTAGHAAASRPPPRTRRIKPRRVRRLIGQRQACCMRDEWVSTREGRHLVGRRRTSTSAEVTMRKAVHAAGGRFRLHRRIAPGCTPDFVIPSRRVAVFVDGCFWHSCPQHGRKKPWSGPNADLWAEKMRRNAERDKRSTRLAEEAGWKVVRVWECEVYRDANSLALEILEARA